MTKKKKDTDQKQLEMLQKMAVRYPLAVRELKTCVMQLAEECKKYPVLELLKRAYWKFLSHTAQFDPDEKPKVQQSRDGLNSLSVLEFIQNYYASLPATVDKKEFLTEEAWQTIYSLVVQIDKLLFEWTLTRSGWLKINEPDHIENELGELFNKMKLHWLLMRGDRYDEHEIGRITELLLPHDEIFVKKFGITAQQFVDGLQEIKNSFSFGIQDAGLRAEEFMKRNFKDNSEEIPSFFGTEIPEELSEEAFKIADNLLGLGTCDVGKISGLPNELLDQLSWDEGEDVEFWQAGDLAGLPLKYTPMRKRPFLRIEGKYYCFGINHLFDNIYRVIERMIRRLEPSYESVWSEKQKIASETSVYNIAKKILPDAKFYQNVFYGKAGKRKETDLLVIYDRTLLIFETKAIGALSISPVENFPLYIDKLKDIVLDTLSQGNRLADEFNKIKRLDLYEGSEKNSPVVLSLDANDYDVVVPFAISLDGFTHMTSKADVLEAIGVSAKDESLPIALDDLRVCGDIFENRPLQFLHYLTKRLSAKRYDALESFDELEHVGLYIKYNDYVEMCRQTARKDKFDTIFMEDANSDIDVYYAQLLFNKDKAVLPSQEIPGFLLQILEILQKKDVKFRVQISKILLDGNDNYRSNLQTLVKRALYELRNSRLCIPMTIFNGSLIVLNCIEPGARVNVLKSRIFAWGAMKAVKVTESFNLFLEFNQIDEIIDIQSERVVANDAPKELEEEIDLKTKFIASKLVDKSNVKLGRNDLCFCGSGIKYKKCCLNKRI